jgi:hypothetical protein
MAKQRRRKAKATPRASANPSTTAKLPVITKEEEDDDDGIPMPNTNFDMSPVTAAPTNCHTTTTKASWLTDTMMLDLCCKMPKLNSKADFQIYRRAMSGFYHNFVRRTNNLLAQKNPPLKQIQEQLCAGRPVYRVYMCGLFTDALSVPAVLTRYGDLLNKSPYDLKQIRGILPKMLRLERAMWCRMTLRYEKWDAECTMRMGIKSANLLLDDTPSDRLLNVLATPILDLGLWTTIGRVPESHAGDMMKGALKKGRAS